MTTSAFIIVSLILFVKLANICVSRPSESLSTGNEVAAALIGHSGGSESGFI